MTPGAQAAQAAQGMRRVLVIGGCGSGKTRFAKRAAARFDLPLTHLDALYWTGNWETVERAVFDERLAAALAGDRWIIDGNYSRTMPLRMERADTVFWFDLSRVMCLFGFLERFFKNYGRSRDDMGGDCRERLDLEKLRFFHTTLWQNRKLRPRIRALLREHPGVNTVIFRSRREADRWLEACEREGGDDCGQRKGRRMGRA